VGYAAANGPAIFDAGRTWAKTAEHQPRIHEPVAMSRTAVAVDGAVPNYGSSPVGLATGGNGESATSFQQLRRGPDLQLAQDAGDPSSGAEGQGSAGSEIPAQLVIAPTPDYRLFVDKEGVYAVELLEAGPGRGVARLLRGAKLTKFLRNKLGHIKNAIAAGGNRGIAGSISVRQSIQLGEQFVGPGFRITNGGRIFRSADGLRQFRLPTAKGGINPLTRQPFSKTGFQANFESRAGAFGRWINNVHLDVIK
jgi:hypothetical protein